MQIPTALQTQKRFPLIISRNASPQSASRWAFLYTSRWVKGRDKRPRCFFALASHPLSIRELIVNIFCTILVLCTERILACLQIRFCTARLLLLVFYNIIAFRTLDATNWLVSFGKGRGGRCTVYRTGRIGMPARSFAVANSPQARPKEYTNSPFELKIISCVGFQQD